MPVFPLDADQITQVVRNIALNGVEAMDGRGRLEIAVSLRDSQVAVAIRDTGRGMPAEERRRVFEPFYSRKPAGTGLGLTIARRIVASHGGRIQIESTPGCGACFTILLALGGQDDDGDHFHLDDVLDPQGVPDQPRDRVDTGHRATAQLGLGQRLDQIADEEAVQGLVAKQPEIDRVHRGPF